MSLLLSLYPERIAQTAIAKTAATDMQTEAMAAFFSDVFPANDGLLIITVVTEEDDTRR